MKTLCTLLIALALSGCANLRQSAHVATGVDAATTAIGITSGVAVEGNPLTANPAAAAAVFLARIGLVEYINAQDEPDRTVNLGTLNSVWWGVAISNTVLLAATKISLIAAYANPLGLVIGAASGWQIWKSTEERREFASACALWRLESPVMKCEFNGTAL